MPIIKEDYEKYCNENDWAMDETYKDVCIKGKITVGRAKEIIAENDGGDGGLLSGRRKRYPIDNIPRWKYWIAVGRNIVGRRR